MARRNQLALSNVLLPRVGEATVSNTASLNQNQTIAFDAINTVIEELANQGIFVYLESLGTITLATSTTSYTKASDLVDFDPKSFRSEDQEEGITWITPQAFDMLYPKITKTGYPKHITAYATNFAIDATPTASENAKLIFYRYTRRPVKFTAGTTGDTVTSDVPEEYELSLLIEWARYLVLEYQGDPQASAVAARLFSDTEGKDSALTTLRRRLNAPKIHPPVRLIL